MTLNQEKLDQLLEDADELITRYRPAAIAPTWNRHLETLGIYAVINQLWQDPQQKIGLHVQAMQPVLLAAFEMGREAEKDGTA